MVDEDGHVNQFDIEPRYGEIDSIEYVYMSVLYYDVTNPYRDENGDPQVARLTMADHYSHCAEVAIEACDEMNKRFRAFTRKHQRMVAFLHTAQRFAPTEHDPDPSWDDMFNYADVDCAPRRVYCSPGTQDSPLFKHAMSSPGSAAIQFGVLPEEVKFMEANRKANLRVVDPK